MIELNKYFGAPGRTECGSVPDGMDAVLIASARTTAVDRPILHIARDDLRMARMAAMLEFADPGLPVFTVPAWDCLPYDRVSPNAQIVAARLDALARLAGGGETSPVVLTTVSAVLQRLPPRATLAAATLTVRVGEEVSQKRLMDFLTHNGYHRAGTVREPGEYAIRGGIVDLFPPGQEEPLRLDFFGDELETVRRFDAMTQRTTGNEQGFTLRPVSETPLSEESIQRFRHRYRAEFGAATDPDPLYEAISAGQRHVGMEHWLPLFHDHLETLFDYLPGAAVTLDHQVAEAAAARLDLIAEYYEARRAMLPSTQRGAQDAAATTDVYKPVPPDSLFLTGEDWRGVQAARPVVAFAPFALPDDQPGIIDAGGRRARNFTEVRANPDIQLFDAVRDRLAEESRDRTVLIAAYSTGSRDRLGALLGEHGLSPIVNVGDWREATALPRGAVGMAVVELENGFTADSTAVYSEQDILGERLSRPVRRRRRPENFIAEYSTLTEGDFVVHADHGIGRYDGLETLTVEGAPHDCLRLIYHGDDKLYLPVENLDVLSRYGSEDSEVQLDRLGGQAWQARKARAKERIRDIANELLKVAADRQLRKGVLLNTPEGDYDEFSARFEWTETDDQQRAIEDVLGDLAMSVSARPRSPCAQPSSPSCRAIRWRWWCPPRFWHVSITRTSGNDLPACRCESGSCRAWSARRIPRRRKPAWPGATSISPSAPMRCWPRVSNLPKWAC